MYQNCKALTNRWDRVSAVFRCKADWTRHSSNMATVEPLWYEKPKLLKKALRQVWNVEDLISTPLQFVEGFIVAHYHILKQMTSEEIHNMPQHKAMECICDRARHFGDRMYLRPRSVQPVEGGTPGDSSSDTSEEDNRDGTSHRGSRSNASYPHHREY